MFHKCLEFSEYFDTQRKISTILCSFLIMPSSVMALPFFLCVSQLLGIFWIFWLMFDTQSDISAIIVLIRTLWHCLFLCSISVSYVVVLFFFLR